MIFIQGKSQTIDIPLMKYKIIRSKTFVDFTCLYVFAKTGFTIDGLFFNMFIAYGNFGFLQKHIGIIADIETVEKITTQFEYIGFL